VYLYPGVKKEVDEKRYLHRVEKLHTHASKTEISFERIGRCWVTIPSTRRSLRPLISQRPLGPICVRASRWRTGRGTIEALLRAAGIVLGLQAVIALALVAWTRRKKRLA